MKEILDLYKPVGEGICKLLSPHAEVVIHDLRTGCIHAIFNNLSKRSVGDASLVEEKDSFSISQEVFPPYFKTNWDGRKMRCVTSVLKNPKKEAIGLMCINFDISKWEEIHNFILDMIRPSTEQMEELLFKNDWREKINIYVTHYLKQHALRLTSLNRREKQQLLLALQKEGAFETKNAASYVADVLQISRATVYKYLKELHENTRI